MRLHEDVEADGRGRVLLRPQLAPDEEIIFVPREDVELLAVIVRRMRRIDKVANSVDLVAEFYPPTNPPRKKHVRVSQGASFRHV